MSTGPARRAKKSSRFKLDSPGPGPGSGRPGRGESEARSEPTPGPGLGRRTHCQFNNFNTDKLDMFRHSSRAGAAVGRSACDSDRVSPSRSESVRQDQGLAGHRHGSD